MSLHKSSCSLFIPLPWPISQDSSKIKKGPSPKAPWAKKPKFSFSLLPINDVINTLLFWQKHPKHLFVLVLSSFGGLLMSSSDQNWMKGVDGHVLGVARDVGSLLTKCVVINWKCCKPPTAKTRLKRYNF